MLSTTLLLEVCVTFDQPDVGQVIRKYGYRYSRAVRAYAALNVMGAAMRVRGCISHTECDCHAVCIVCPKGGAHALCYIDTEYPQATSPAPLS